MRVELYTHLYAYADTHHTFLGIIIQKITHGIEGFGNRCLYVDNFNVGSDCGCAFMPKNPNRNAFCMAFFKRSNARVDD